MSDAINEATPQPLIVAASPPLIEVRWRTLQSFCFARVIVTTALLLSVAAFGNTLFWRDPGGASPAVLFAVGGYFWCRLRSRP